MMRKENVMDGYAKIDQYNPKKIRSIARKYTSILEDIGEDPNREGLARTPERVAKALQFLTHGYDLDPAEILRSAMFTEEYQQMLIVRDIELYSLCEHHMLPFFGKAHRRIVETAKSGRCVCTPVAGAGAPDRADPRLHPADTRPCRCCGGDRSAAHVHDHAWHSETALGGDDLGLYRRVQQ